MTKFAALFASGLLALPFATGCTDTLAKLSVVSTRTADFGTPHERSASQASASDGRMWLLILPLGGAPTIEGAINDLLQKYNGDYVTDAKVTESGWTLLLISGGSITVTGDVWTAGVPGAPAPAPAPMK
jgi:hypothetical protein